jgi:hypothetical protein
MHVAKNIFYDYFVIIPGGLLLVKFVLKNFKTSSPKKFSSKFLSEKVQHFSILAIKKMKPQK